MPSFNENTGSLVLINDKSTTVVLDIGHAYSKIGFAGENSPRAILKSEIKSRETGKITPLFEYTSPDELRHHLIDFMSKIYFKHLLVNPKDRRVIITEDLLGASLIKDTLALVLFKYYEVLSILFVPSHLVSLYTLGISSALVIEIGYKGTSVIPIYENVVALCNWQALPLGSEYIHNSLSQLLLDRALCIDESGKEKRLNVIFNSIPEKILEDIKVRCCFVSTLERKEKLQKNKYDRSIEPPPPPPNIDYPYAGKYIIKIPGTVREMTTEVLFEKDDDDMCLSNIILNSIIKCPIDMRKTLAGNIVLTGGTSSMNGLKHRVMSELKTIASSHNCLKHFKPEDFKIHSPPAFGNCVPWLGASIMGCTESIPMKSITRDVYLNDMILPDWSNNILKPKTELI